MRRGDRLQDVKEGVTRHGPQTVHLDVTNSCNTNCVTCWDHSPLLSHARPAAWKRQRVDVDATRALLDDIQSLDDDDATSACPRHRRARGRPTPGGRCRDRRARPGRRGPP